MDTIESSPVADRGIESFDSLRTRMVAAEGQADGLWKASHDVDRRIREAQREIKAAEGKRSIHDVSVLEHPELAALMEQREALKQQAGEAWRVSTGVAEATLAQFTKPLPDRPWVEPRKVPALAGVPVSQRKVHVGGIATDEWINREFQHPSAFFNTSDRFYLPSDEYMEHFKTTETRTGSRTLYGDPREDREIFDLMSSALMPLESQTDPKWIDWIWYNWALATKIVGLDVMADKLRTSRGAILSHPKNEPARFQSKEELFAERDRIIDKAVKGQGQLHRDDKEAKEFWSILAAIRWDRDHNVGLYDVSLEELLELYSEFNYILETTYPLGYRAEYELFAIQNSLARVVMGGRGEQYYHGAVFGGHDSDMYVDEVDAIFLAAVHIRGEDSPGLRRITESFEPNQERAYPDRDRNGEPLRYCLYGVPGRNKDHHLADEVGLVLSMGMQYFRMDEKLRQAWRPVLSKLFGRMEYRTAHVVGKEPPTLFIYGTTDDGVQRPLDTRHGDHLPSAEELRTAVETLGVFRLDPEPLQIQGDQRIAGFGADKVQQVVREEKKHWISEDIETGEVESGMYTQHWIEVIPLAEGQEREAKLALRLRPEDRLPLEAAKLVREVAADPEAGNLDKMGTIKRVVERMTGRQIKDLDIVHTLTTLGQLKGIGLEAMKAERGDTEALLFEAQLGERSFFDLDQTTQLLIILRAANRLPKVLVVEHLIQSLDGAVPISMLRLALRMEEMIRKDRPWEEVGQEYTFPLFTGRERIEAARKEYGAESPQFRRTAIETYCQFLGTLQAYHEYEGSITDFLTFLEVLEQTGRPMSQCGELAHVGCEMQNMMIGPEGPMSHLTYRERFIDSPLGQWLKLLRNDSNTSTFDHVKIWTELPAKPDQARTMVVDETTGHAWLTRRKQQDLLRTVAMKRGEYQQVRGSVGDLDYTGREVRYSEIEPEGELVFDTKQRLPGPQLTFLGEMLAEFPQLRQYAENMAPDHPVVLSNLMGFADSDREKHRLLKRILEIAPRSLADDHQSKPSAHQKRLVEASKRLHTHQEYCQALFILHILRSKYHGSVVRLAETISSNTLDALSLLPSPALERDLRDGVEKGWILEEDATEARRRQETLQRQVQKIAKQEKVSPQVAKQRIGEKIAKALTAALSRLADFSEKLTQDPASVGLGFDVNQEIGLDAAVAAAEFKSEHQRESAIPDHPIAQQFVELDPAGAGFAIAEVVRGLEGDEMQRALEGMGLVLLAAERDFGYQALPAGVEQMWDSVRQAAKSQGLEFPAREQVLQIEGNIRERIAAGGRVAGLLTKLTTYDNIRKLFST